MNDSRKGATHLVYCTVGQVRTQSRSVPAGKGFEHRRRQHFTQVYSRTRPPATQRLSTVTSTFIYVHYSLSSGLQTTRAACIRRYEGHAEAGDGTQDKRLRTHTHTHTYTHELLLVHQSKGYALTTTQKVHHF